MGSWWRGLPLSAGLPACPRMQHRQFLTDRLKYVCVCVCNALVQCLLTVPQLNTDGRVCYCLCTAALQAFHCLGSLLSPHRRRSKGITVTSLQLITQNFGWWEWQPSYRSFNRGLFLKTFGNFPKHRWLLTAMRWVLSQLSLQDGP